MKKYMTPCQRVIHLDSQITFMQVSGAPGAYDLSNDRTITPNGGVINSLSRDNVSSSWDNEW